MAKAPDNAGLKLQIQQERDFLIARAMLYSQNGAEEVRAISQMPDEHIEYLILSRQGKLFKEPQT